MKKFEFDDVTNTIIKDSAIPLAVYQYIDGQVKTIALSQGFLDIFGVTDYDEMHKLMDHNMYRDCHPDDIAMLEQAAILFATKNTPYNVIYRSKFKDGYRIIHAYGSHIKIKGATLAVIWYANEGFYQDEGEQKGDFMSAAYSNLLRSKTQERLTQFDILTGLPNVSHFLYLCDTVYFNKMIEEGKTPVIIFFDFIGMKNFNAKLGFVEGDKLIQAFARLLAQKFGSAYCSRFGMDNFCVFTNDDDLEKRIQEVFAEAQKLNDGKSLYIKAGVYSKDVETCGTSFACDRAKMACETIKGVNESSMAFFDKTMLEQYEKRRYIIDNIDRAIAEGWIKVFYQPIIRAANGKVCNEEALSRWIDQQKGFLSPADFIPVLEDANLIYKLDLYVVEEVLKKMKAQKKKGLYITPISINLSRSDFDSCDIVEELNKRVKAAKISTKLIIVEITESVIGKNYDYMKTQVNRLRDLGFNVWMDDFGSGYSSLDVLHDINFDLIKFDMKFMQDFGKNERTRIMLSGLLKIAMDIGMETICEGVEAEDQVEFLKEAGCSKLQGFYYCRPISPEEVFARYDKGIQIGFENPDESDYYRDIGMTNIHSLAGATNSKSESYKKAFNTPPMVIFEVDKKELAIIRENKSYKEFVKKQFGHDMFASIMNYGENERRRDALLIEAIKKSKDSPEPVIINQKLNDGSDAHIYIRRIAQNPVTKKISLVAIILSVSDLH